MTSRSPLSVRAIRLLCTACIISLVPATAWLQEQAPAAAAQQGVPAQTAPSQAAPAAPVPPSIEQQGTYMIRQGDTLWDIANTSYRDPFLWPLIWKSNPSINDPDLIYPGTALTIPSLAPVERAMSAPEEPVPVQEKAIEKRESAATAPAVPQEETAAPAFFRQRPAEATEPAPIVSGSKLVLPEETARPIIDKYAMISSGFVSEETSKDYLQGSVEDPTRGIHGSSIIGYDQEVYIVVQSREQVAVGDRFLIYEEVHAVRHPITGKDFGKLYKVNGIVKVTGNKEKNVYIARVTLSFDAAMRGNLLAPYQDPTLIYPSKEKQTKDIAGYILDVPDRRSISGQSNIVYLDKGAEDGVAPGDRFTVMSEPNPSTGVRRPIGEVQVFIVKARTATAFIRKSIDTLSKGYSVVFKNQ